MKRRDFIALIGTAAAISPLAAREQQLERPRLIGILIPFTMLMTTRKSRRVCVSVQARASGRAWLDRKSSTFIFDYRFYRPRCRRHRTLRNRRADCARIPDVIAVWSNATVVIVQKATQTIPIIRWRIRSCRKWLCYQPQPPDRKHHRISGNSRGGNRRENGWTS